MVKNKATKTNSQNPGALTPLVLLGNSSKNQLKSKTKQWVK